MVLGICSVMLSRDDESEQQISQNSGSDNEQYRIYLVAVRPDKSSDKEQATYDDL